MDLILLEFAIACMTSPLNTSFSEVLRIEARLIVGQPLTDTAHFRPAPIRSSNEAEDSKMNVPRTLTTANRSLVGSQISERPTFLEHSGWSLSQIGASGILLSLVLR